MNFFRILLILWTACWLFLGSCAAHAAAEPMTGEQATAARAQLGLDPAPLAVEPVAARSPQDLPSAAEIEANAARAQLGLDPAPLAVEPVDDDAAEPIEEPVLVHQYLIEYCVAVIAHSNDPAFGPASDWLQSELGEDFEEEVADMFYTNMAIMLSNGELDPDAILRAAADCSVAYKTVIGNESEEQSSGSRDEIPPIP